QIVHGEMGLWLPRRRDVPTGTPAALRSSASGRTGPRRVGVETHRMPGDLPTREGVRRECTVKSVGIVVKRGKPEAGQLARELVARFPEVRFLTETATAQELELTEADPGRLFGEQVELLVVLGGDGRSEERRVGKEWRSRGAADG